jgi:hypothetical protein
MKILEFILKIILLPVYLISKLFGGVAPLYENMPAENTGNQLNQLLYTMNENATQTAALGSKLSKMDENINVIKSYTDPKTADARFAKLENRLAKLENSLGVPPQQAKPEIKHPENKRKFI